MFPSQARRKTVNGDPCALSARKLPIAITASDGNGGKKFSNADSAAIAMYRDPSGRSPSQAVIECSIRQEIVVRVATAMQAIPSLRPIQPMPSFDFPLTLTLADS